MAAHRKGLAVIASLLVDARPVHGTPGLPEVAKVFTDFRRHPAAMDLLLSESLSHRAKVRDRTIRDVFTGRGDAFDIKMHGLLPVVSIARWAALGVGSTELQTVKRIRDASGSAILTAAEANRLVEVFEILQRMRLRHHLDRVRRGLPPSDLIDRDELSPIERSMIGQAVREINAIGRRMDRAAVRTTALARPGRRKAT
jgi:CBS domain-containing protein